MSYRGPSITYKIRKTTVNNKTGDNFGITVPRIIAQQFEDVEFSMIINGSSIVFESGCKTIKTTLEEDPKFTKKMNIEGTRVDFT